MTITTIKLKVRRAGGRGCDIIEPRTLWLEIDYLHANPVRRELCERPEDWHWSSAADYANIRTGPLEINFRSLPRTAES